MNDVRTFRAPTMQAALDLVRRELGSDALILHTRQVSKRRLLPWSKPIQEVEITAGLGDNVRPVASRTTNQESRPLPQHFHGKPLVREDDLDDEQPTRRTTAARPAVKAVASTTRTVDRLATAIEETEDDGPEFLFTPQAAQQPALAANATRQPASRPALPRDRRDPESRPQSARTAPRPEPRPPLRTPPAQVRPVETRSPRVVPSTPDQSAQFADRLDAIERMLEQLGRTVRNNGEAVPSELFQIYSQLIDRDVEESVARNLITRLKQKASPEQLASPVAAQSLLKGMIESQFVCGETIVPARGRCTVAALVGATGVGKTTTLAKLAANFKLRDKIRVGLVTVDTYRIAAVEQLRTYAEIIDLPMKVVTNPTEMRRALDELTGLDLVLIDTAGRSPLDSVQIQELNDLLDAADVDQAHLVLNVTAGVRHIQETIERFNAVEPNSVILTKLDEAADLGSLLSITGKLDCPISYLTTGQDVPDDIEPARAAALARMVLGEEEG